MRLTEAQLKTIVKEELAKTLKEGTFLGIRYGADRPKKARANFETFLDSISFVKDENLSGGNTVRAKSINDPSIFVDFSFNDKENELRYHPYKGNQSLSSGALTITYQELASEQLPEKFLNNLNMIKNIKDLHFSSKQEPENLRPPAKSEEWWDSLRQQKAQNAAAAARYAENPRGPSTLAHPRRHSGL